MIKKSLIFIFLMFGVVIGLADNVKAQTTVDIDIYTYYNGDYVAHSTRTVDEGDTLIYEVGEFPDAVFMYWLVNDNFRDDLQQTITITIYEDTILEIHFGSDTYYLGFNSGYYWGYDTAYQQNYDDVYELAYDLGYDEGLDDGYYKGINENLETGGFGMLLASAFIAVGSLLSIQLLPNISIGAIVAIPIVFGVVMFIIGRRKE